MGYKRSKHFNAVLKLVREKKFVLQKDAQSIMNGSINTAVEQLEAEGRIKRKKVGVRYKNGNLNYQWLLYLTGTDHNELLEYEKELINRPFESPLKVHHCYKKNKETNNITVITEQPENSNVIDMSEYVRVNNHDLSIKEFKGERVVTVRDIATLHNKPVKKVNEVFNNNRHHFISGEDYFIISRNSKVLSTDLEKYFTSNRQKEIYFFTETGYLMLIKSFKDKLSWTVQRQLVNTYFKMKELSEQNNMQPIPAGQIQSLDIMEMMIQEMKKDRERVEQIENKLNQIVRILTN